MPIEAVIFDYGKVLSNPEDPDAQRKLIALTGLERPDFDHHYWRHRNAYNQGHLNGRTYWEKIAGVGMRSYSVRLRSASAGLDWQLGRRSLWKRAGDGFWR